MDPTTILMEEHRVIEGVLDSLETAAGRLRAGEPVDPGVFLMAVDFIRGFADGSHHRKEEGVLFPAMEAAGVPREAGPIGVMLAEHEQGRQFTAAMRASAEKLKAGDTRAAGDLVHSALGYVALLRGHIMKEDNVLFPMADQVITGAARAGVDSDFGRELDSEAEAGVREKFIAIAENIKQQARG